MQRLAIAVWLALACTAGARTWTSSSGSKVEADFVALQGSTVVLQTTDGKKLSVGLGALSPDDQSFVKSQSSGAPAAAPGSPTAESLGLPAESPTPAAPGARGAPPPITLPSARNTGSHGTAGRGSAAGALPSLGATPVPGGVKPTLPSTSRHGGGRHTEPATPPTAEALGVPAAPAAAPAAPAAAGPTSAAPGAAASATKPGLPAAVAPVLPAAGRPAAGRKAGGDALLTEEQIAALQNQAVIDEKTGDKIEFVGGMSPKKRLNANDKDWKDGDPLPVRITCELTLVRQKKDDTERKRIVNGKVHFYMLDEAGNVVVNRTEGLELLAPDNEKGFKAEITKVGKYRLVMFGDYKDKPFGLKEDMKIGPPAKK